MCIKTKSKVQEPAQVVSTSRWLHGLVCSAVFTMTYILTPPYIVTSILALLFRYPSGKFAGVYSLPLIVSILTPSRGMPGIVGMLTPILDYFDFESVIEDRKGLEENIQKGERYIFCCQPHGVISFCGMCSAIENEPQYRKIQTAAASAVLHIPILKNIMGIFSLTDASRKNLSRILRRKGVDGCVVLYVGGIAELFKSSREEERLYLSERKGFIKLALQEGVDIIPVYLFGNTSILSVIRHGPLAKFSRRMQLSFTFFWGKWNLPIPRDEKLLYVAGKAITMPKIAEPTQDDIDQYHKKYVDEVARIFDAYKLQVPMYKDKTLFID